MRKGLSYRLPEYQRLTQAGSLWGQLRSGKRPRRRWSGWRRGCVRLQVLVYLGHGSRLPDETYISIRPDQERCFRCNAVALPDMFVFTGQLPLPQRHLAAAEDLIVGGHLVNDEEMDAAARLVTGKRQAGGPCSYNQDGRFPGVIG